MSAPTAYPQLKAKVEYPDSDGEPMAESDFQRTPLIYAVEALRIHFQDDPNVYVSGNMLLYYEEGNPQAVVAPDVFVVIGAEKRERSSYMLWREPKAPDFVLEITSKSTVSQDQGVKKGLYAFLGVAEYFQYDPTADYLEPPLQGYRLVHGNYEEIPPAPAAGDHIVIHSNALGLDLELAGGEFHYRDPASGKLLFSHEEAERARREAERARQDAEARAQAEAEARKNAEKRIAELEARLRALQAEDEE
jgi:Uma2 family endonuclease